MSLNKAILYTANIQLASAFCSSVVEAPISCLVRSSPFSVATCTFQVDTGNSGRSVMRGTEAPSSSSAAAAGR